MIMNNKQIDKNLGIPPNLIFECPGDQIPIKRLCQSQKRESVKAQVAPEAKNRCAHPKEELLNCLGRDSDKADIKEVQLCSTQEMTWAACYLGSSSKNGGKERI